MRVETLGATETDTAPAVAVVGAIHGDEPCGAKAIDRFLSSGPADRIQRPVKLIVANERALEAGTRYVERDLNRLFPGDPDGDTHEERLAHDLWTEIEDCVTLGFHATVSFSEPFGTLANPTPLKAQIMTALPIEHAADFSAVVTGRSVNLPQFMNVEAGYQGSEQAAENAYECLLAYLRTMDALPGTVDATPTTHYEVTRTVEKDPDKKYQFIAENFERVPPGTVYATTDSGETLTANNDFWPVLMSATGHETLLGYQSIQTGDICNIVGDAI